MKKDIHKQLKSLGFKKKWLSDKSGWWYEKVIKHWLFKKIEVEIDGLDYGPVSNVSPTVSIYIDHCNDPVGVTSIENLNKVLKLLKNEKTSKK